MLYVILPVVIAIGAAYFILPENCSIEGYQDSGLSCDAIPNNCCPANDPWVTLAQAVVLVGIVCGVVLGIYLFRRTAIEQNHSNSLFSSDR